MATITGNDRNRARALVERFDQVAQEVDGIAVPDVTALRSQLIELSGVVADKEVDAVLRDIDIRVLESFGHDVAPLRERGMLCLLDAAGADGVAGDVATLVRDLRESVRREARLRLDADARPAEETALLQAVRRCDLAPSVSSELERLRCEVERLRPCRDDLRDLPGPLAGLFQSSAQRARVLTATETLERELGDLEGGVAAVGESLGALGDASDDELWDAYASDPQAFSRTLASLTEACDGPGIADPAADTLLRAVLLRDGIREASERVAGLSLPGEAQARMLVVRCAERVKEERTRALLSDIGVDALVPEAAGVAAKARGRGIGSVLKVLDAPADVLSEAVGEKAARDLVSSARRLQRSLLFRASAVPGARGESRAQEELVLSLVSYARLGRLMAEREMCVAAADGLAGRLGEALGATGPLGRDDGASMGEALSALGAGLDALGVRLARLERRRDPSPDEAWAAFLRDPYGHRRVLETVVGPDGDEPRTTPDAT